MYNQKKLQEFQAKVRACYANNPLWQVTVLNQQWLCPYCGDIGTTVASVDKMVPQILHHLLRCPAWQEFRGALVPISDLKEKAVGLEVASQMQNEPNWQNFDFAGNWYCPYCAQAVPTEYARHNKIVPAVLTTAQKHLMSCERYSQKALLPAMEVSMVAQQAKLIGILANKLRTYAKSGDKRWFISDIHGKWRCPYCMQVQDTIDVSVPLLRTETAPKLMADHLIRHCAPFQKKEKIKELLAEASASKNTTGSFKGQEKKYQGLSIYVLYPEGDLDTSNFPRFEMTFKSLLNNGVSRIIINFCKVNYLNSTALGILIKVMDICEERGGALMLCNLPPKLAFVINTLSMDTIFRIYPDEEQAIRAMKG